MGPPCRNQHNPTREAARQVLQGCSYNALGPTVARPFHLITRPDMFPGRTSVTQCKSACDPVRWFAVLLPQQSSQTDGAQCALVCCSLCRSRTGLMAGACGMLVRRCGSGKCHPGYREARGHYAGAQDRGLCHAAAEHRAGEGTCFSKPKFTRMQLRVLSAPAAHQQKIKGVSHPVPSIVQVDLPSCCSVLNAHWRSVPFSGSAKHAQ